MIVGDDGGAQVTMNAGTNWSTYHNQPTAQFYRVTTDNHFPYRILGAQQDNSTVRILSRGDGGGIDERDWEPTAGSRERLARRQPEGPRHRLRRQLRRLPRAASTTAHARSRNVTVWPDNPLGHGAADLKYRFQWNFPIFFSPHDANTLYAGGNVLFKTTDEGQSWTPISPDLTRNDKSKLGPSGGPITKDNTGVEVYCTIFCRPRVAAREGRHLVRLRRRPAPRHPRRRQDLAEGDAARHARLVPDQQHRGAPDREGRPLRRRDRYKLDDFRPYLFKTTDYGKTWTKIVTGIKDDHFTRVVRADPKRPGLLYAGTECGMYVSFDDGAHWQPFQLNLPIVPITDLAVKNDDLVVATQGRAFWVLDDLTPLHQLKPEFAEKPLFVFAPRPAYRLPGGGFGGGDDDDAPPPRDCGPEPADRCRPPNQRQRPPVKPAKEDKEAKERLNPRGRRSAWRSSMPGTPSCASTRRRPSGRPTNGSPRRA